jgi:hypothetical protein
MSAHRVPVLAALHRFPDPERSADPRVRELVGALRGLPVAPEPSAHFRAELRAQLVAVAPRLVVEGPAELIRHTPATLQAAEAHRTARVPRRSFLSRLHGLRVGRPLRLVTATMTVLILLLGGTVWMSRGALPGDTLYGVKRASESVQLSLTTGDAARGRELLSFAKTRADEVQALLGQAGAMALGDGPQAGAAISDRAASLITNTLGSADDDVREASRLLGNQAVRTRSAEPLDVMTSWAPGQLERLRAITERIPAGQLHERAAASTDLVSAALDRARALQAQVGCDCLRGASDELGPVPCTDCLAPNPVVPGPTTQIPSEQPKGSSSPSSGNSSAATNSKTGSGPGGISGSPPGSQGPGSSGPGSGSPGLPGVPDLPLPSVPVPSLTVPLPLPLPTTLPPLPLPLPSTPLTANSCGLSLGLGPIGIGIGTCGITVGQN